MNILRKFFYRIPFLPQLYHWFLSFFGAVIYGYPSRKITVIGVTGTKGKSTVLSLVDWILNYDSHNHFKTALLSSIFIKIGDEQQDNLTGNTMPGRFFIQKFLQRAVKKKCRYALIEVTSEGIKLGRHKFIDWDAAVFLNLHPEHIEAHGGFENYKKAKISFFKYAAKNGRKPNKKFFINKDDQYAQEFSQAIRPFLKQPRRQIIFFSKKSSLSSPMYGEFNRYNVAAAETITKELGISQEVIKKAIAEFPGIPGRMEFIQRKPFAVIIDYAHTPESLEKVYQSLKPMLSANKKSGSEGKMICVLGSAGGGRDKWKRPEIGKIAGRYCSQIIITNEDPYDEDPEAIINDIYTGCQQNIAVNQQTVQKIKDRREAIEKAIESAKAGDLVIITGKGSEQFIHIANGRKIPWSDKKAVIEALKHL